MRILFFSHEFGGVTTTFIYREVRDLAERHDVHYLCLQRDGCGWYDFDRVHVIPDKRSQLARRLGWMLWTRDWRVPNRSRHFGRAASRKLKVLKPDLIHCHFGFEALTLLLNVDTGRVPIVITFQGYDASEMLKRRSYIRALNSIFQRRRVKVLAVSRFLLQRLQDAGVNAGDAEVLYTGIDTSEFSPPTRSPSERFVFLQVSSLTEKKGHLYTVRAFRRFLDSREDGERFEMRFVGSGPCEGKIRAEVQHLRLQDQVRFLGPKTSEQIVRELGRAHAFVHHSVTAENGNTEGLPNAVVEAMLMELPVLATRHAGIPEVVEHGVNGLLVPERDVEAYAGAMAEVVELGHLPQNRRKAEKMFSLEAHGLNLQRIYSGLL